MRVAHLLRKFDPSEWGGTETAIERLASGLAAEGVDSVIYAPQLPTRRGESSAAEAAAPAASNVRRFHARVPVWGISAERKRQLVALGGNVISFDLFGALWREPGLDVIHSHALGRLGATGRTVARRRGLPFVLSVHGGVYDLPPAVRDQLTEPAARGWDWGRPLGLLLRARHLFSEADAVITCNPREAALIRERHPGRRVLVQPHGVPAAVFAVDHRAAARRAFPMIVNRPVLLVPGRIDPTKNQGWLVGQAKELIRRWPDTLLVFVGPGTDPRYTEGIRQTIAEGHLERHVLLAGPLPSRDPRLIGLFQEARAVILSSVSETFGLVILEAWAAGTPVLSSRTSGALALVQEERNGWLYDLAHPESFQRAATQLFQDPGRARAYGAAGRAIVAAEYDTRALARRMRQLYEELIAESHALRHSAR